MNMSFSAAHESKAHRKSCQSCMERKARFRYRGAVRSDRDHTLCFECYRSERDRRRACLLAENDRGRSISPFAHTATLSVRNIAHRRAMLAHLRRQPRVAVSV
jgi:hypothetical protein